MTLAIGLPKWHSKAVQMPLHSACTALVTLLCSKSAPNSFCTTTQNLHALGVLAPEAHVVLHRTMPKILTCKLKGTKYHTKSR